jgi:hypothetical protein
MDFHFHNLTAKYMTNEIAGRTLEARHFLCIVHTIKYNLFLRILLTLSFLTCQERRLTGGEK